MYWGQGGEAGRAGEKRTPAWLEQLERGSEREILWGFCQIYVVLGLHFVGGRGGEVAGVVTVIIKVGERSRSRSAGWIWEDFLGSKLELILRLC